MESFTAYLIAKKTVRLRVTPLNFFQIAFSTKIQSFFPISPHTKEVFNCCLKITTRRDHDYIFVAN